jgi:hypothetical protein
MSSSVVAPDQPPQETGLLSGIMSGFTEDLANKARIARGEAFTTDPNAPPPVERSFLNELGYGIGGSGTMLAGGIGGGLAGTAVGGPIGGLVGAGLGAGGAAIVQDMVPAYDAAIRNGNTHDEAVNYAIKHSLATGAISAATAPLFALAPFRSIIGKILFQAVAVQPAAGAAVRVGVPAAMGEPLPTSGEMARGYAQDVLTGAGFAGAHAGYEAARAPPPPRPPPGPEATAAAVQALTPTGAPSPTERVAAPPPAPPEPPTVAGPAAPPVTPGGGEPAAPVVAAPPVLPEPGQAPAPPVTGPQPPATEPPPDDRLGRAAGGPPPEAPLGEPNAPSVQPAGVPANLGGEGDQGVRPPDTQGQPAGEPAARPAEPAAVEPAAVEPAAAGPAEPAPAAAPVEPTAAETRRAGVQAAEEAIRARPSADMTDDEVRAALEPLHGQALEGMTPAGLRELYNSERENLGPSTAPSEPAPAEPGPATVPVEPTGAPPAQGEPARRPVTKTELKALDARLKASQQALARAERDPATTPERLDTLRQRAEAARTERANAEGPPTKASYLRGTKEEYAAREAQHQAATEAHAAAIDQRVNAEGSAPTPEPAARGKIFSMGDRGVIRGKDSAGNSWIGNGYALVKGKIMDAAARAAEKLKGSTTRPINPDGVTRVVTPDPKVDYRPITWERTVTDPNTGQTLVLGTRADGTYVALQKPVYDTLHAAAGKDGVLVTRGGPGKDDRVFARVGDKYTGRQDYNGVGMPINVDQARAEAWARGGKPEAAAPATLADRAAGRGPETTPQETTQPTPRETPEPTVRAEPQADLFRDQTGPGTSSELLGAEPGARQLPGEARQTPGEEPLTTEPDHIVPNQHVAKNEAGEVVGKGPTPEAALADARGETPTETAAAPEAPPQSPQLQKLLTYRDQVQSALDRARGPAQQRKLGRQLAQIDNQIARLRDTAGTLADTAVEARGRASPVREFTGPPQVGRPKDIIDYKFANGTSVNRLVFGEAGYDPNTAGSLPIATQIKILTNHLINKFGFKSVEVVRTGAGRVDERNAVNAMLDMSRAIQDYMAALGQPPEAASFHGAFKLVFDPQGKVNHYGAYVPALGEIRVTSGANSFGHEWTHAIDHMLANRYIKNTAQFDRLLSQHTRNSGLDVTDNVQAAFAKVINTMFYDEGALAATRLRLEKQAALTRNGKPTASALTAQDQLARLNAGASRLQIQISKFRSESAQFAPKQAGYWANAWEMLARAHEAYTAEIMQNAGVDPTGVVMPDKAYINETDRQLRMAYPKDEERTAIFKAFDELHQALLNEQVLSQGKPAASFSDLGVSDPSRWKVTAPNLLGTPQGRGLAARLNAYKNFTKNVLFDRSRPDPGQHTFSRTMLDSFRGSAFSLRGILDTIIKRAPDTAQKPLTIIRDLLATRPGQGKYTGETFGEASRFYRNDWSRVYGNIMRDHGLDPNSMTPEQGEMWRHVLTTAETTFPVNPRDPSAGRKAIPPNIVAAGGPMRDLLNHVWGELRKAGIDIGYAKSGYFPRLWDQAKIFSDPAGFIKDATRNYKFMFDQEVGHPGDDPAALLEKWTGLSKQERERAGSQLQQQMRELQINLRKQAEIEANPAPTAAQITELTQLKTAAEALAGANHDDLGNHIAGVSASEWYGRLLRGGNHDFDTTGPSGSYIKTRVLPPETDLIMRNWLHTQPSDAIPHYINGASNRLSYAERFGVHGEYLDQLLNAAGAAGVRGEDLQWFEHTVNVALGRDNNAGQKPLQRLTSMAHAFGSIVMMPRAMWSGLAEPMNASLVTGQARTGFKIFANQFGRLMRNASAQDVTELAHFLNVTTSPMVDSIMLSRTGADYADTPALNRLMTLYYKVTGLTGLVNSQRVGAVAGGNWFLAKLARDFQGTDVNARDDATRWFKELGLPEHLHDDFSQWMLDLNGGRPSVDKLQTDDMGSAYGLAMRRLVERIIQEPFKIDRAAASNRPGISLIFQLMSFNYSFQHNVLNPLWDRIEHSYGRAKLAGEARGAGPVGARIQGYTAAGGSMAHAAAMVGTVLGAGLMVNALRQAIFAPDQWAKHDDAGDLGEWLLDLTFQRSGLNGTLDPIIQLYSHLRYDADISSLMDGASVNYLAKNLQDVIQPLVRTNDSPNTNTIYYNQARGLYNLIGVPLAGVGLTMLGSVGGPVSRLLSGAALQLGTSPYAAGQVAETAAGGPKGTKLPKESATGLPSMPNFDNLIDMPDLLADKNTGATEVGSGGITPWGLLDDVAVPAWRYGQGVMSKVPGPLKALAAAGALGYAVNDYVGKTQPFRDVTEQNQNQ